MKSYYVGLFQFPWLPELALSAGHFFVLKNTMVTQRAQRYVSAAADCAALPRGFGASPGALSAMLNWYRARARRFRRVAAAPGGRARCGIIWGERDAFFRKRGWSRRVRRCATTPRSSA